MFSFHLRTTRGSGLKKDNREAHEGVWRHRVRSCLQRLWPFSQRGKNLTKASQGQDLIEQDMRKPCRHSDISSGTVVKLVNNLVPSLQKGDPSFVPAFLSTYRRCATTLQVLDLLFLRYSHFTADSEEDEQVKNTLCSFLETWMDKNPEDFCDLSDLLPLKYLKAYLSVYMPHCDLSVRVKKLLTQLEEEHAKDSQVKDEDDSDLGTHISSDPEI
ncbi:rCG64252, partial [Rattus norvegicus]